MFWIGSSSKVRKSHEHFGKLDKPEVHNLMELAFNHLWAGGAPEYAGGRNHRQITGREMEHLRPGPSKINAFLTVKKGQPVKKRNQQMFFLF
jgi:hypothetical protein